MKLLVSCHHIAIGPFLAIHDSYYLVGNREAKGKFLFHTNAYGHLSKVLRGGAYSKDSAMHLKLLQVLVLVVIRGDKLEVQLAFMGDVLTEEGYYCSVCKPVEQARQNDRRSRRRQSDESIRNSVAWREMHEHGTTRGSKNKLQFSVLGPIETSSSLTEL